MANLSDLVKKLPASLKSRFVPTNNSEKQVILVAISGKSGKKTETRFCNGSRYVIAARYPNTRPIRVISSRIKPRNSPRIKKIDKKMRMVISKEFI
jgi:hypothetical protein